MAGEHPLGKSAGEEFDLATPKKVPEREYQ
jgi:hypothetical protein